MQNLTAIEQDGTMPLASIRLGDFSSTVAGAGARLLRSGTQTCPYRLYSDDAGAVLYGSGSVPDIRGALSRTLLTTDHTGGDVRVHALMGQIKAYNAKWNDEVVSAVHGRIELVRASGTQTLGGNGLTAPLLGVISNSGAVTVDTSHVLAGCAVYSDFDSNLTQTGSVVGFYVGLYDHTNWSDTSRTRVAFGHGIKFGDGAVTTGVTFGTCTTAISIAGATATGISITGACSTAALQMGVSGTTAGDFIWYGTTALYKVLFDADGDTNGAVYIGADTKGLMFNLYGDTTGCGVFWDPSTDTNGTLSIGASGGSKGNDVVMYGVTNGNYAKWDQSANSLLLVGTSTVLNVAGTTASTSSTTGALICAGGVGIGGATYLGNTLTVGGDDTGYDVKFYGATSGSYCLWDESADGMYIVSKGLHVTSGRALQVSGDVEAAAHADRYGVVEINANLSGAMAGPYGCASSTWVNFAAGSTPSGIVAVRNDGIYLPTGITATAAKMIIGGRFHYVADDGADPGSLFLFSTNIFDNKLTALLDINAIGDLNNTTVKSGGGIAIPFAVTYGEAPGTVYYLNLYTS